MSISSTEQTDPSHAESDEPLSYTDEENDIENRSNQSYKAFDTGTRPSGLQLTPQLFEEFKKAVFASRPNIANLYTQVGSIPFYNYAKSHIRENRNKIIRERKPEFAKVLKEHIRKVLGSGIAESIVRQMKTNDSVSTVQHFSPLSHPDSLNAVLENALPYFGANNPAMQNVIVLACAGVSFNNTKFPRGHLFHSFMNETMYTNQLNLFGHTVDARPVIHHSPYSIDIIKENRNLLFQLEREGKISKELTKEIMHMLTEIYAAPHPLSANDYIDQLTITNYWLFKKLFANYNKFTPSLVYLSQEKIVLDLLVAHHLHTNTTIHRILFDKQVHELLDTHFEGVTGAFSVEKGLGTYLFWGLPKGSKYRVQLWRNGNKLESKDGTFSIELTPQNVQEAINKKELIPSVMLTFFVLALYYGLFLGGGYEQTYYLTQTKKNYLSILEILGDQKSIDACEGLITTNLVIPRPLLMYLEGKADLRVPATGLDMLLYGDNGKSWNKIIEASKKTTVAEIIERTLPSIYREYTKGNTNESFAQLAEADIEKLTGLGQKIPPLAHL